MVAFPGYIQLLEMFAAPKILPGHDFHQAQHLAVEVFTLAI
jgi:hypothetical protein